MIPHPSRSFRLVVPAFAGAVAGLAALAAQTPSAPGNRAPAAPGDTGPQLLEAYVVTGSNIRRVDQETTLPVSVIDLEEIDLRGASTMSELFESYGLAAPPALSELNVAGQDARGDNVSIDLRGLGSGSTLTLINGRRMAPHPVSQSESGTPSLAANINSVPSSLLARTEILRDGASAIYGADATAGVINNIVSRRREGLTLTARTTMTQDGGGNEYRFTSAWGRRYNRNRTHVSAALDYFHRDALSTQDRWWSRDANLRNVRKLPAPWNGLPVIDANGATVRDNDFDNRSSISALGSWIRGLPTGDGGFAGARPAGNRGISLTQPSPYLTLSTAGAFYLSPLADGSVGVRQTAPSRSMDGFEKDYFYNTNLGTSLANKTDRWQAAAFLDHRLGGGADLFADLMFYRAFSVLGRTPLSTDATDEPNIAVGVNNPYNPFGSRFYHPQGLPNADGTPRLVGDPAEVLFSPGVGTRVADWENRRIEVKSTAYRALVGLRGKVGRDWEWESALLYSGAQTRDTEFKNIRESRLRTALARADASAFNPFGYTFRIEPGTNLIRPDRVYRNPAGVLDPLYDDYIRFARTALYSWDAKINGRWLRLLGNELGWAAGTEIRHETYGDKRPPYAGINPSSDPDPRLRPRDNDFIALSPSINISAQRTIYSAYSEVLIPVFSKSDRIPFVRDLEFTAAGRFERFPGFGNAFKPKFAVGWNPVSWLKFRGALSRSFRAPNLVQTNVNPLQRSVTGITDYYRSDVTGLLIDGSTSRTVFRQGNQSLRPEQGRSHTIGAVVDVPGVRGLSFTVDAWTARLTDVIANTTGTRQMLRDELLLDLETQRQLAAGTPIGAVDLGSGSANYKGNRAVTRAAPTDADRAFFNTFNASRPRNEQRAPVGRTLTIVDDYTNLGLRERTGWDLGAQWRSPRSSLGTLTLRGEVSRRLKYGEQVDPDSIVESFIYEDSIAKWRGNFSATWRHEDLSFGWFTSYFGRWVDTTALTTAAVYNALGRPDHIKVFNDDGIVRYAWHVNATILHNLNFTWRPEGARWKFLRSISVRGGLNNVLNTPPVVVDNGLGFQPATGATRGRQYWLELSRRF
jgi:iron complex outermembrane receptor protein